VIGRFDRQIRASCVAKLRLRPRNTAASKQEGALHGGTRQSGTPGAHTRGQPTEKEACMVARKSNRLPRGGGLVLVADDDSDSRDLLAFSLVHSGYRVKEARDGLELLGLLTSVSAHELEPPVAIVSDVRMPGFSGIEALRHARHAGLEVPFVLITAYRND